jgi:phosphoribosylaminoimidazolecarboxamide formyltransferase/IMP cyclohydrolase
MSEKISLNRVGSAADLVAVRRVLLSVWDKTGLDRLVRGLVRINPGIRFYSTGGTHAFIQDVLGTDARAMLTAVSEYTGQPELQGGLVKTLDYKIYLGLLGESDNPAHRADVLRAGAVDFDLCVVNLYPFEKASAAAGATLEDARANIDIGGPCMLRASAKNFLRVASLCDPADYETILAELDRNHGSISLQTRYRLARAVFERTSAYDQAIAEYLGGLPAAAPVHTYLNRK